jgi:hypothetical protein
MVTPRTSMSRLERPVSVEVGVSPRNSRERETPPDVCIVGIAPPGWPWLADVFPRSIVRDSQYRDQDVAVEHIRLLSREGIELLPGLSGDAPSRVRDSVQMMLGAGARSVDVVLVRGEGLMPWDLHQPEFLFAVDPFTSNMLGTMMIYPDLGGPIPLGPGTAQDAEERVQRFILSVKAQRARWVERYQLALLDAPEVGERLTQRVLSATASSDASLCRWAGEPDAMHRHGWRSAAAFVGGIIASRPGDVLGGISGSRAALTGGRSVDSGRFGLLDLSDVRRSSASEEQYFVEVVPEGNNQGFVRSEPTLRTPVGSWSIPAIRVAKVIHWQVMQAASRFVFETADVSRAIALAATVSRALQPYHRAGLLVSPEGNAPEVRGGVVRDPAAPGLRVEIAAVLRPWSHRVSVRVNLRQGSAPMIEEVA